MTKEKKTMYEVAISINLTRRDHIKYPRDYYVDSPSDRMLEIGQKLKIEFGVHHISTVIVRDGEDGYHLIYPFSVILENGEWSKLVVDFLVDKNKPEVDSLTPEFPGVVIAEREAYDMMGIVFKNHPDLRRLLTPDIMPSDIYPLRKDISAEEIRNRLAEEAENRRSEIE